MTDTLTARAHDAGLGTAVWEALGCSARLVTADPAALPAAREVVEQLLARVDLAASRFRDDSELAAVHAADGGPVAVSALLAHLVQVALDAARWTDGLLDPTVGQAMADLGYDRTYRLVPADGPAVTVTARPAPGWQRIGLEDGILTVPQGIRLDLGATAKGVAADFCARDAAEATGCGVLVSLGGDVAVAGPERPEGWPVLVGDVSEGHDRADDELTQTVAVHAGGLATSGVRARRWRRGGSLLHHIVDPRVGLPAAGPWRTVSVAGPTCVLAGAAATTAVIRGDAAPAWLRERGLAARLVSHDGAVVRVSGWPEEGAAR